MNKLLDDLNDVLRTVFDDDSLTVTPASTAKFDWSVGIFAKTVTQSELAANAAAKQVNCQNLMPPAPWIFFLLQGSAGLAFFFVARRASVNHLSSMWHIYHNSSAPKVCNGFKNGSRLKAMVRPLTPP